MKNYFKKNIEYVSGVSIFIITLTIYALTLAPTVSFIDSGELATVACTLGIAHPTGYPIFSLLGRVFSELPIASEPIVRLNVMSAFFVSASMVVFYFLVLLLLKNQKRESALIASVFSTLALAFSQTIWNQATIIEVYSLHLLLLLLTLYFFIFSIDKQEIRWWIFFAYLFGVSFTNHLTTILVIPAIIYLFFTEHGLNKHLWKKIAALSVPFFAGLSIYLYLPIRASSSPLLNWGNPQSLEKLLWHVSGKQFRVWMFSSTEAAERQFKYFFSQLPNEFFYIPLLFTLFGVFYLITHNRKMFIFIFLLFVTCIAYSINYDIHDIDSYFILAFIASMLFSSFGIVSLVSSLKKSNLIYVSIFLSLFVSLQIFFNWKDADQSKEYLVEDYTKSILNDLPKNSIVITYQWDYFVASSYYFQHVKNIRPDIAVIDKELLRRSWYYDQLKNSYPLMIKKSEKEIQNFLDELYKFEHDLPYDFSIIEGSYVSLIKSFIEKNIDSVHCFVGGEVEQNYTQGYLRVPNGLLYELRKDTSYVAREIPNLLFRKTELNDTYKKQLKQIISTVLYNRSNYEKNFSRDSLWRIYLQKSSEILAK